MIYGTWHEDDGSISDPPVEVFDTIDQMLAEVEVRCTSGYYRFQWATGGVEEEQRATLAPEGQMRLWLTLGDRDLSQDFRDIPQDFVAKMKGDRARLFYISDETDEFHEVEKLEEEA